MTTINVRKSSLEKRISFFDNNHHQDQQLDIPKKGGLKPQSKRMFSQKKIMDEAFNSKIAPQSVKIIKFKKQNEVFTYDEELKRQKIQKITKEDIKKKKGKKQQDQQCKII